MTDRINMAKFVTWKTLCDDLGNRTASNETEKDHQAKKAAATTNYFFGDPSDPTLSAEFDLPSLHTDGCNWLRQNALLMELVIQSLRVRSVIESMRSGKLQTFGEPLLREFGREFPESPTLDSYAALVDRAFNLFLPEYRKSR